MSCLSYHDKTKNKRKQRKPKSTTARIKILLSDRLSASLVRWSHNREGCAHCHKHPSTSNLFKTTTPNAPLQPPKDTKEPGFSGRVLASTMPEPSRPALPASLQSAAACASCLPTPASPRPEPCKNRGVLSPKSTSQPPHPRHRTVHYVTHFKFPPVRGQLRKKKSSRLL